MEKLKLILPQGISGLLVAVSGGADSVALLALLREAAQNQSIRLTAAHFEHGIRAEDSLADAAFVRDLCKSWNIPLIEGSAQVLQLSEERSVGIEEAARDARYAFLRQARAQVHADYIALAHHRDDQAESILMHWLRGCGLRGLVGMQEVEGDLYRPLLNLSKEELLNFLEQQGISWREDATNYQADNPRNGLRLEVFPQIERFYPSAKQAICRFAEIARLEDDYMVTETDRFLKRAVVRLPIGWLIQMRRDEFIHSALWMRAIHALTGLEYAAVQRAYELCALNKGSVQLSGTWRAERASRGLYLLNREMSFSEIPLTDSQTDLRDLGTLYATEGNGIPIREKRFVQEMNAQALCGAVVRTRRAGDVIHPLGAQGKQKLKEYFINRHIDRPLRDVIPLVAKGNEILWVMGEGISEKVKLREGTKALRLELINSPIQKLEE